LVDLAEIQFAYYILAATGVLVAAIYYIINLRYNMIAKEMEICRLFTSDYTSDQGMHRYAIAMNMEWADYDDFIEKYGHSSSEKFSKWYSLFFVWETLGYLVKRKIVKAETLYALGAWGCIRVWEKYKDVIENHRSKVMGLDWMVNFEFIASEMLKIKMRNDASFKDKLEINKTNSKF
jgi:hypothetical protein